MPSGIPYGTIKAMHVSVVPKSLQSTQDTGLYEQWIKQGSR